MNAPQEPNEAAPSTPASSTERPSTIGPAISFALAAVGLILALYWLTMPTEGAGKWSTEHLIGVTVTKCESERSSRTPRVSAAVCAGVWFGWSAFLLVKRHRRQRLNTLPLVLFMAAVATGCGDSGGASAPTIARKKPLATSTNWEVRFFGTYQAAIDTAVDPEKAPRRPPSFKTPSGVERFTYFDFKTAVLFREAEPFDVWYEFESGNAPDRPTYVRVATNAAEPLTALVFEGVARTTRGGFKDGKEDGGFPFKPSTVEIHASGGTKLQHQLLAIGSESNWTNKIFRVVPERARGVYTPATQGERFFWVVLLQTNVLADVTDLTVSNLFEDAALRIPPTSPQ